MARKARSINRASSGVVASKPFGVIVERDSERFGFGTRIAQFPGMKPTNHRESRRPDDGRAFIPDPCPYPYPGGSSLAEGVIADKEGNVYGADFLGTVRKFVKR